MSLWRRVFTERRSVLVPLVGLLVIDGLLIGAGVIPLRGGVATETASAEAARYATALSTQRLKQMQGARSSRERAELELKKFYGEVLPSTGVEAIRLVQLEVAKLARENNLTLGARTWEDELIKDSPLRRVTTKVELLGEHAAIRHFLYDVETSEAFLAIRTVQLSQANAQKQLTGQLQLALEIATYYRDADVK